MPCYDITLRVVSLVPRATQTVDYTVQAPDYPAALERAETLFGRSHPRWRIVAAPPVEDTPPIENEPPAPVEGALDAAKACYDQALAAYSEAKIQVSAAQGRCRAAKRALLYAYQDVQRASGQRGAVMVPR